MNLKERVLDLLVDRAVLMEAAQRAGVSVSDKELQYDIMSTQYFQRNGVFDRNVYQRALSLNRVTPAQYETIRKGDLVIMKMTRLIGETTELTPDELKIINSLSGGNQAQLSWRSSVQARTTSRCRHTSRASRSSSI